AGVVVVVVFAVAVMVSAWLAGELRVLDGWNLLGQPLSGAATGQARELAVEMRLVVVPAGGGDLRARNERWCVQQHLLGSLEPCDPPGHLGTQPEFAAEPFGEVLPAPPDPLRERFDAHRSVRPRHRSPRPGQFRA